MTQKKLSIGTKAGFGVADLGGNLFFTAMGFWSLNYLTDVVGLAAGAAGIAIMVGKLWDAVTDPIMGYISDHTTSPWGRRRPWLLFGSIPLMLGMIFFFSAPNLEGTTGLAIWAALALCFLNTAYTMVNIPYSSLTPDLTQDYHERTSLNGWRFGFAVIGTIVGAAVVLPIVGLFGGDKKAGFTMVGIVLGAAMAISTLITFFAVREPPLQARPKAGFANFIKSFVAVLTNKPFVILLFTYALHLTAITFLQGILVYYFKYIYHAEAQTTFAMVGLLVTAMVFIPISVVLSKRIGKKLTYQIAFAFLAVTCILIYIFGEQIGVQGFLFLMVLGGIGVGFAYVAPFAMVPDAIDWQSARTGIRNEGAHYGMWTFFSKVGTSLAVAVTGFFLGMAGYQAELPGMAAMDQSKAVLEVIRFVIGPLPAFVFVVAIVLLHFYPIDEKTFTDMSITRGGSRGA